MADSKITALSEDTAPSATDLLLTVDDPSGTPANKKATIANVGKAVNSSTAAYGSRAAAAVAGKLYLPSDGYYLERDTGAAYASWGPIFPLTPPVDGDFAWVNQGTGSVTTTYGGVYLYSPTGRTGDQNCIRKKAAPTVPYTITAMVSGHMSVAANFSSFGLCFRQSSDGKLHTFSIAHEDATLDHFTTNSIKWTNETSFSAAYVGYPFTLPSYIWLRIADDNTNRVCSYSFNGRNFITVHSVGRTDFLTADEVGFFVNTQNTANEVGMQVYSWVQG